MDIMAAHIIIGLVIFMLVMWALYIGILWWNDALYDGDMHESDDSTAPKPPEAT